MFVFQKIWRALFSCYLRFEIRLLALSPTKCLLSSVPFLPSFEKLKRRLALNIQNITLRIEELKSYLTIIPINIYFLWHPSLF